MGTSRDRRSPTDDDEVDNRGSRGSRDRANSGSKDDDRLKDDERRSKHRSENDDDEGSANRKDDRKGRRRDEDSRKRGEERDDDNDGKSERRHSSRRRGDDDDNDGKSERRHSSRRRGDDDDNDGKSERRHSSRRRGDDDDNDGKSERRHSSRRRGDDDDNDGKSERRHSSRRRGDDDRRSSRGGDDDRSRRRSRSRDRRGGGGHHRSSHHHHRHDDDRDRSRRRSPSHRRRSRERRAPNRRSRWSRSPERRKPFKFDSPPKELAATLMGGNGGLLPQTVVSSSSTIKEAFNATLAAERQKIARELYIGQIPPGISAGELIDVLNDGLMNMGANAMPGRPIVHGWLGGDGLFAFVEFRTAEEASIALERLNGHQLKSYGVTIKVGRPKGYMGPAPEDSINAYNAGNNNNSGPSAAEVSSDTNRLCLIGFPMDSREHSIKKALRTAAKGDIRHLEILKHIWNNNLVVLAVFECEDPESELRLKRKGEVEVHGKRAKIINPRDAIVKGYMNLDGEIMKKGMGLAIVPSRILVMTNFAGSVEELLDDVNYNELLLDIKLECKSITGGADLRSILIPRPETNTQQQQQGGGGVDTPNGVNGNCSTTHHDSVTMDDNMNNNNSSCGTPSSATAAAVPAVDMQVPGLGCCFMEFRNVEEAAQVKRILDGRIFGGHEVFVTYFSETRFTRGDFANPMPNTDEPEVGLKDIGQNPPPIDDGMGFDSDDSDDMDVEGGSDNDMVDPNDIKVRKKAPPPPPTAPLAAEDLEIID